MLTIPSRASFVLLCERHSKNSMENLKFLQVKIKHLTHFDLHCLTEILKNDSIAAYSLIVILKLVI